MFYINKPDKLNFNSKLININDSANSQNEKKGLNKNKTPLFSSSKGTMA